MIEYEILQNVKTSVEIAKSVVEQVGCKESLINAAYNIEEASQCITDFSMGETSKENLAIAICVIRQMLVQIIYSIEHPFSQLVLKKEKEFLNQFYEKETMH